MRGSVVGQELYVESILPTYIYVRQLIYKVYASREGVLGDTLVLHM